MIYFCAFVVIFLCLICYLVSKNCDFEINFKILGFHFSLKSKPTYKKSNKKSKSK